MGKCTPLYLVCHYEPDHKETLPYTLTIAYSEIESSELNDKIAGILKDFEKKYLNEE